METSIEYLTQWGLVSGPFTSRLWMAGAPVSCKAAEILYKQSPDTSNCKEPEKRHWREDLLDVNDVSK